LSQTQLLDIRQATTFVRRVQDTYDASVQAFGFEGSMCRSSVGRTLTEQDSLATSWDARDRCLQVESQLSTVDITDLVLFQSNASFKTSHNPSCLPHLRHSESSY